MGILKIPRITTTQRGTITPEEGELLYDTTNDKIYKGDGSTVGGIEVGGGKGLEYVTTAGSATAYTATVSGVTAYTEGDSYLVKFHVTNTGNAPTINISSVGAKTIVKNAADTITAGDILIDKIYLITYDGTRFQLVTALGGTGGGIIDITVSGTDTYTATGVSGVSAYNDGDAYVVRFTNGNEAAQPTLNINSLGAKILYRNTIGDIFGGDIPSGSTMLCVYNSTLNGFQTMGTSPNALFAYVTNDQGSTITKGQVVYASGGVGDRMKVKLALNTGDSTSAKTVGVVYSTSIANGQKGIIIMQGLLDGLSILDSPFIDGSPVYLGDTAGSITKDKPYAPDHLVYVGTVTTASAGSAGRMYVKIQNGYELDEIHDVDLITNPPIAGQFLRYDGSLWKNSASTLALSGNTSIGSGTNTVSFTTSANTTLALPASGTIISTVTNMAFNPVTGTPTSSNFLRGDGTWAAGVGTGSVASGTGRRLAIYAADGTGLTDRLDTSGLTNISIAAHATGRQYTIANVGGNAEFVMSQGDQTIAGNKSFTGLIGATAPSTSNTVGTNITLRNIYNNTSTRTYSNITGGAFVGITFTASATTTAGSLVRLGNVNGLSNLSTTTDYYIYSSSGTTARLALSYADAIAGIPITTVTGTYTGPLATMTIYASPGSGSGMAFTTGTGITPVNSIGSTISSVLLGYAASQAQPSFELVFSNMTAGAAATERMRLSNGGILTLTNSGLELPKVHTAGTVESTGNRFIATKTVVGTNTWEQGINYATSFAGAAYKNNFYDTNGSSAGISASLNFIAGSGTSGNPTGAGAFHFFVPEVASTIDQGYGVGYMSPLFTVKRNNQSNPNSTSALILHGPRKPGLNTKTINSITSAANILTITFTIAAGQNISDLSVNQFVTISGVNSQFGLYNGVSGRIISVTNDTVNLIYRITMYSAVVDNYTDGGTLTPTVRTDNGYSSIYIAIEKDDVFSAASSASVGLPKETRVLWYTRGSAGGSTGLYSLLTNNLEFINSNENTTDYITERIVFGAHSTNIGIAENVTTGGTLNIGTGATTGSGNTKTINFGTGGGSGTTTNIIIGSGNGTNLGFFGSAGTTRPAAYTKTYSGITRTHSAKTAALLTNNTGGTPSTTLAAITAGTTYTQADMTAVKNALASLADQVNKLRTDNLVVADLLNQVINDLQAYRLLA